MIILVLSLIHISLHFFALPNDNIGVYENTIAFGNHVWNTGNRPSFDFIISDTTSFYNIYVVLRHTDAYHYNNIWLNVTAIPPGDTARTQQLNLKLGDNNKWFGSAMDDVIEDRILITHDPIKLKKGNYTFILQHIMRQDDLHEILDAGIRVEKSR